MPYLKLVYFHLATILPAFGIGTYMLFRHKGTQSHKLLGKIYMILMLVTASATLLMPAKIGPQLLNHFGLIHIFSLYVLYAVPSAYISARNGDILRHRDHMIGLYIGGILFAGALAFLPGRLLHG